MIKLRNLIRRPFIKDTLKTTVLVIFGKAIGVTVPFFIAAWFGATTAIDSFFLAYSIIIFLSGVFGTTMSRVIVPYIIELKKAGENIGKFISSILILSCITYFILLLGGTFLIKEILRITTDYDARGLEKISTFILEMIPFVIFLIWANTLDGFLNSLKKFTLPALLPAIRSIIIVAVIFLFKGRLAIQAIVLGYIGGELVRFLILFFFILKKRLISFHFSILLSKNLMDFIKKGLFQIIAATFFGINPLIDKTMGSWEGTGSVSILYYADRLYLIPVLFLVSGFLVTLLSYMSGNLYLENKVKFRRLIHKAVKSAGIVTLVIMIGGLILYKPLIRFVFSFSTLSPGEITTIQEVFFGYFIGLLPYIISQVYGYALIAMKKTKVIMYLSIITFLLNIILNYLLMQLFHLTGLALSTSIIRIINCIFYGACFYFYYNKLDEPGGNINSTETIPGMEE
jgi:putative peptidoglycan lipid II flippase